MMNDEQINTQQNIALKADEYQDPVTGLILCRKCHTPRRLNVQLSEKTTQVCIRCRCQQEAWEQEEQARKHREFLDQVARNRSVGLPEKFLRDANFSRDLGYNPEMEKAKRYVANWAEMRARSMGLLLWGNVGTGKSYMAACIANALLDQGVKVLMTNFARILNTLTGLYNGDRNEFVDSLNQYELLILDDLGMERGSEFAREQVFHVIDSRYRSQLPMIVTTNLTIEELRHPGSLALSRLFDRVLERCIPVCVNRQNIRRKKAAENMEVAKKLLESGL